MAYYYYTAQKTNNEDKPKFMAVLGLIHFIFAFVSFVMMFCLWGRMGWILMACTIYAILNGFVYLSISKTQEDVYNITRKYDRLLSKVQNMERKQTALKQVKPQKEFDEQND